MPRSNRPRRSPGEEDPPPLDVARIMLGRPRVESRADGLWNVQGHGGPSEKTYICPGCNLGIPPGTTHIVAWRADGLFGEADDLAARRHWHEHCWRIRR